MELRDIIERAWDDRSLLKDKEVILAIKTIIEDLDNGDRRVAEPTPEGWVVNEWIKKAVILYFPIQKMETIEVGPFEFHDKMKLKTGYAQKGVRVVPHAIARYGAYVSRGVIMMPSYVMFFVSKYYFSDINKKNSFRSLNAIDKKINLYSQNLPILDNDTQNIIEYAKNTKNKKKKKYYFWELINKND